MSQICEAELQQCPETLGSFKPLAFEVLRRALRLVEKGTHVGPLCSNMDLLMQRTLKALCAHHICRLSTQNHSHSACT